MKKPDEKILLEKFTAAINELGLDSFYEIPDHIFARAIIAMMTPLAIAYHKLREVLMMDVEFIDELISSPEMDEKKEDDNQGEHNE
jgi:hypothetical protein